MFSTTYELEEPQPASFDVEVDGAQSRYAIGDSAELQVENIHNPVTGAEIHPRLELPEGLLVRALHLFASKTFRVNGSVAYDHSGRYAALGAFEYSGGAPREARAAFVGRELG